MHPNELRRRFREFFIKRNHAEIPSSSLVPSADDPTVLFTTAGMQPLVPNLLGAPHPKGKRLFDTQKSFRTPDIDEVGDDTHLTFFEMLGNWSLGDYFKEEAIELAYDFFVDELGLDPKRFAITIFEGDADAPRDDEAEAIWLSKPGITKEQIFEFDKKDNFWGPAGKTGPCGPCSEIHYDRGEAYGENFGPNCDDNQRFVEIWNLVFMEFDKKEDGSYEKLAQKNVDTGVGFERLVSVLQQKDSPFDTELFEAIINKIEEITGKKYVDEKRAFRIIADHVRGATFCIADGVTPGNEGRNYVLRRLIRRAVRSAKQLGVTDTFLTKVSEVVIAQYKEFYPELDEHKPTIMSVLTLEEQNFRKTLERGEKMLNELSKNGKKNISGTDAFKLFDTFGFPVDLTKDFAEEHGIEVDEAGFEAEMQAQQARSRSGAAASFERDNAVQQFANLEASHFVGYSEESAKATVLGLMQSGDKAFVVLSTTPFYAESGGQVGDSGEIVAANGKLLVEDCQKTASGVFIHSGTLEGEMSEGDAVLATIDGKRRGQIMRHHSLAHLFLNAAQKVLGKDIHQAGSHVNEHRMRIDVTFPRAIKHEEIAKIEQLMATAIAAAVDTEIAEKSLTEAKAEGVEATFGEKYGETVRTVRMGDFSYELCGGTHVPNIGIIGAVKIVSESGVSAGVRRIEAVCGLATQELLQSQFTELRSIAEKLKVPQSEMQNRLDVLFKERKELTNINGQLQKKLAVFEADELAEKAVIINNLKTVTLLERDADAKTIGQLARTITAKDVDVVIIQNKQGNVAIATSMKKNASELFKGITEQFGGGGGGSANFASGGGVQPLSENVAEEML
jgi:alanyl-tRNA synthetase